MRVQIRQVLAVAAVLLLGSGLAAERCFAVPVLTQELAGASPDSLIVGDTLTITLRLSGLRVENPGDGLTRLFVDITNSAPSLLAGTEPIAGSIVPSASSFSVTGGPFGGGTFDGANVEYADANSPISRNGIFFSFQITALLPGTGVLSYPSAGLVSSIAGTVSSENLLIDPLPYTILAAPIGGVPEPATLALLGAAFAGVALTRRRRCSQAGEDSD